jgi:AcrR family transcriptional regulator
MTAQLHTGRTNQKERTRTAIIEAARKQMAAGTELSMPLVATSARVSEATAYRYFPDLASVLSEAFTGMWPSAAESLEPVAHLDDPVERIAYATEALLHEVSAYQGAVRAMIAASIVRPDAAPQRPGRRFGLIDEALAPLAADLAATKHTAADHAAFDQLKRDLAIVVSAEAFFSLTDLCGLDADAAIASAVHTARTLTAAAAATLRSTPSGRQTRVDHGA